MEHRQRDAAVPPGLWDYSLAVYGSEGVAPACLALQDEIGLDVNLLLLCLWAGLVRGTVFGPDALARARAAGGPWQRQVLGPLRSVRRYLRTAQGSGAGTVELRARVLALELAAEHAEQELLLLALGDVPGEPTRSDRLACAAANLAGMADLPRPCGPGSRLLVLLGELLAAAAGVSRGEATAALLGTK